MTKEGIKVNAPIKKLEKYYLQAALKDMLNHVVAVLILEQLFGIGMQLLQDGSSLFRNAKFQNALNHSASVGMRRQGKYL